MGKRFDFKVQGLTPADEVLASVPVELHDDGSLRFLSATGSPVVLKPAADLNALLIQIFTGPKGFFPSAKEFTPGSD